MSNTEIWRPQCDGDFADAFLIRCLTPKERQRAAQPKLEHPQSSLSLSPQNSSTTIDYALRSTLVSIVLCRTDRGYGGVVLKKPSRPEYLALEFTGFNSVLSDHNPHHPTPLLYISHAFSNTLAQAELFLRDVPPPTAMLTLDDDLIYDALVRHINRSSQSLAYTALVDVGSGLMGRDGYIAPCTPLGTKTRATALANNCVTAKKEECEEKDDVAIGVDDATVIGNGVVVKTISDDEEKEKFFDTDGDAHVKNEFNDNGNVVANVEKELLHAGPRWEGILLIFTQLFVTVVFAALLFATKGSYRTH